MKKTQMIQLTLVAVISVLFANIQPATASSEKAMQRVSKELKKILNQAGIPESNIGAFASFGGEVIINQNANKKMIPASITKIVTAASTLRHFAPGFKFKTVLASAAPISPETLKGDLYLVGGGDPSFVSENMWFLVNAFSRNQIRKIDGDLIVDDSLFDQQRYDPSRQKERVDRAYDAPVGAMSFNWNSINIFIRPGAKVGDPAHVFLDPENEYVRLKNTVKTTSEKTATVADRDEGDHGVGDLLKVSGSIAIGSKEIVIYKNITQPDLWAGYNLKSFLAQRGILVSGKVRIGTAPANVKILAESESKSIQDILADMNKFSNNYVAEMFCKNISVYGKESLPASSEDEGGSPASSLEKHKIQGSISGGMKELKIYLESLGVSAKDFDLINPSGLTRENRLTAEALWKVLNDMRSQFLYQPEFMSSSPIAGIDGTLKKRFKNGPGERWVRAKTGYLNGVVSLAGYAGRRDGSEIPFVFMFNGSADEAKVRAVFDKLAIALVDIE